MYPHQSQFNAGFNNSIMYYGGFPGMQFSYPHAHHNGGLPGLQVYQQSQVSAQPVSAHPVSAQPVSAQPVPKREEIDNPHAPFIDQNSGNKKRVAKKIGLIALRRATFGLATWPCWSR